MDFNLQFKKIKKKTDKVKAKISFTYTHSV